jgi:hypothetical protein
MRPVALSAHDMPSFSLSGISSIAVESFLSLPLLSLSLCRSRIVSVYYLSIYLRYLLYFNPPLLPSPPPYNTTTVRNTHSLSLPPPIRAPGPGPAARPSFRIPARHVQSKISVRECTRTRCGLYIEVYHFFFNVFLWRV